MTARPALRLTRRQALITGVASMALPTSTANASSGPSSSGRQPRFDREQFVSDCQAAALESDAQAAVSEVLARAVSTPDAVLRALGEPSRAGLDVLVASPTLTIFAAHWTPNMTLLPHDHAMWASIGLYTGREDNILWRRGPEGIRATGAQCLFAGDVARLPDSVIHSVTNPLPRFTAGLHIYGGDFFAAERHQWEPETLEEGPSDGAAIAALFEAENQRLGLN